MARARNIKPAIFKNEILGEADPLLTILFQGLWCLADREGRLEDRPKRIKAEIFPYRDLPDFNGYLTELERLGFICRYQVENTAVIEVINFVKHQSPHKTEKASDLPAKTDSIRPEQKEPLDNGSLTVKESLIPDSLNLIPDSLIPERDRAAPPSTEIEAIASCPHMEIINLYHKCLPELPRVTVSLWQGSTREKDLRARWRQSPNHQSLEFWERFFMAINKLDWEMGRIKDWQATLPWIIKRGNFEKLIDKLRNLP